MTQRDVYPLMTKTPVGWAWASTAERGIYWLARNGDVVGSVSIMPGQIEHEALFMDRIIADLNT